MHRAKHLCSPPQWGILAIDHNASSYVESRVFALDPICKSDPWASAGPLTSERFAHRPIVEADSMPRVQGGSARGAMTAVPQAWASPEHRAYVGPLTVCERQRSVVDRYVEWGFS